jgi:hypothetical protein
MQGAIGGEIGGDGDDKDDGTGDAEIVGDIGDIMSLHIRGSDRICRVGRCRGDGADRVDTTTIDADRIEEAPEEEEEADLGGVDSSSSSIRRVATASCSIDASDRPNMPATLAALDASAP